MKGKILIGLVFFICIVLPALALSIASFVIAAQHKDTTCDVNTADSLMNDYGKLMTLPTWLNVYGGVALGMAILLVIAIALFLWEINYGLVIVLVLFWLYQGFSFAWNIVGAVALFRDSMDCLEVAKPLWAMVLAVLIFQWLGFLSARWTRRGDD